MRLLKDEVEETKLRAVWASSPNAIVITDLHGNIVDCNEAALKLGGFSSKEELVGKGSFGFIAKKDRERAFKDLEKTLEQGTIKDIEYTLLSKSGEEYQGEISASIIKDSSGNPIGFVGILRDITEHKQMEKELRESEERYRELTASIDDVFFAMDRDLRYAYWNKASEKLTGISAEDAIGKSLTEVFPDVKGTRVEQFYLETLRTQQSQSFVTKYRLGDKDFVFEINAYPTKGGLSVFVKDITERKWMEEALRESEEKFRGIFESANDCMIYLDMSGRVLDVNRKAVEVFGGSKKELLGKHFARIGVLSPKEIPTLMSAFAKALAGKQAALNVCIKNKKGQEIPLECSGSLMKIDDKLTVLIIARDVTERNRVEEALRQSEEKYRSIVELAPDGIIAVDMKGVITSVNPAFLGLTGFSRDEIVGKHFTKLGTMPAQDISKYVKLFSSVLRGKMPPPMEFVYRTKDGTTRWGEAHGGLRKIGGKTVGFQAILRDITERKKMEEALRGSEEKYRNLFENARDLILTVDLEGNITSVNNLVVEYGFDKSELVGKKVFNLVPEEHWQQFGEGFGKLAQGKLSEGEIKIKLRSGKGYVIVEYRSNPIIQDNKVVGVQTIARDVTERRKMEEKLKVYSEHLEELIQKRTEELLESEKRYSVLVEEASDGVVMIQDGKTIFANKKALEIVGYSRDELINLPPEKLIDQRYFKSIKEGYDKTIQGEIAPSPSEAELITKTGERIPVEGSPALIHYQGRPAVIIIWRDIRERKRMEEERLKLEKLATIGELATMVGHDLRNPLQSIENATYYLNNELPHILPSILISQKAIEMLQVINDSVNYADKIIRDLHDFSATKKPTLQKTNINAIVKETLSQIEAPENVELITELSHLPEIKVDEDMIKRVFLNLATNGIQAMEKGGALKVSTKKTKGFVEISFKDTGIGISKEKRKKLFTPFFTTKAKGMGLGLPICKKFVESHDGSIGVESEVGKGTTFTIKLPVQQKSQTEKMTEDKVADGNQNASTQNRTRHLGRNSSSSTQ